MIKILFIVILGLWCLAVVGWLKWKINFERYRYDREIKNYRRWE